MELLDRMFGDTLWIYTAIGGSLIGAAFLAWFQGTRMGLWCYAKFYNTMDYFVQRWNLRIFEHDPFAWRKKYPHVTKKIDELEARIAKLEDQSE